MALALKINPHLIKDIVGFKNNLDSLNSALKLAGLSEKASDFLK
jgi:hypothetical protein